MRRPAGGDHRGLPPHGLRRLPNPFTSASRLRAQCRCHLEESPKIDQMHGLEGLMSVAASFVIRRESLHASTMRVISLPFRVMRETRRQQLEAVGRSIKV